MLLITRGFRLWFTRYLPAEIVGTSLALLFATLTYNQTDSYLIATAAGLVGEGIGFWGFTIVREIINTSHKIKNLPLWRRVIKVTTATTTNLLIEFTTAETLNTLFVRPVCLYYGPQLIEPYSLGFLVGKMISDAFFFTVAACGYGANHVRLKRSGMRKRRQTTAARRKPRRRAAKQRA